MAEAKKRGESFLGSRAVYCGAAAALAAVSLLLTAAVARAAFQQPAGNAGVFGGVLEPPPPAEFPEEEQLGGVGGIAVNYTGAGGVPKGTVYAATRGAAGGTLRVAEYRPRESPPVEKEHPLEFALGWEVTKKEGPYERCGPQAKEPLHPTCAPRVEASEGDVDIDIDQATGNVYVFSLENVKPGETSIAEFDANGKEVLARFGERAEFGKPTAETPALTHEATAPGAIAVNGAGEVFVFDVNSFNNFYHRLMVFKPKTPGFTEYEFAGEIAAGFQGESSFPSMPVTDAAGHIYVVGDETVQRLATQAPEPYPAAHPAPICSFEFAKGGITAMTVDPASGEPFFFTSKKEAGLQFKQVHQLSACDGEGKFTETGKFEVSPERNNLYAMAFDPVDRLSEASKPGILYGAAPGPKPNTGGTGEPGMGSLGYIFTQAQEDPPAIEGESVSRVGEEFAEVEAEINPKSHPTRYVFQYLSEAEYEENGESFAGPNAPREAPSGGAEAGNGAKSIPVAATLTELLPETEYRFRALAESHCKEDPEVGCEDAAEAKVFRTFPAGVSALPDNRAYELVSPSQKGGGQVFPAEPDLSSCNPVECKPGDAYQHFPMQSAPDGESVVYEGTTFTPGGGATIENEYIAHRDPVAGWQTTNLTPPLLESKAGQGYKAFEAGLGASVIEQLSPALSEDAPPGYANLYLQASDAPAALTPLVSSGNASLQCPEGKLTVSYAGASRDFSHHFFAADDALTPEATGACGETNLYEWAGGQLRALNVPPGETETAPGAALGSGGLLESGDQNQGFTPDFSHAISSDGQRVFWTAESGALYVRVGGSETVEVPGPGNCRKSVPLAERACFLTASTAGTEVLLSDGEVYALNGGTGAYEEAFDLSGGEGGFEGLVGQGEEDLSHLYFVDTAVLTEAPNDQGAIAQAGKDNLYGRLGSTTVFVGTLAAKDNQDWTAAPTLRMGEASPHGRWLAFLSFAPLTGYDNTGPCAGNPSVGLIEPGPCSEAFLYDSETGDLLCASCNPSGATPIGQTVLRLILHAPAAMGQPRYLTDAGRLFFDSRDSLVPTDTNESAEDVYEYEPSGVGSCARHGGCTALISGGRRSTDSNFVAIDESGANVFFTTRDRLVPADRDDLIDLYDARVGGGFPTESELPRGECQGEACQPVQPPSSEPSPATLTFSGPGNPKAQNQLCRKGQVKRKGRCVRKHKKHQGKHRGGAAPRHEQGSSK